MNYPVPAQPKIYHILHIDKLAAVLASGALFSDAVLQQQTSGGTTIGMGKIKKRRLTLCLNSHPGLHVGECVPFYFCPRSVMLYMFYMDNHPEIEYHGGQEPIVHLEADLHRVIQWADFNNKRWAFTLSNAGAYYIEDRVDITQLNEINWNAVMARNWQSCRDAKQSEFLLEREFPWHLFDRIGVFSVEYNLQVKAILDKVGQNLPVEVKRDWYY